MPEPETTEKDLADSISKGADLGNFDEELDDEPHATADFDEAPIIDDNELLAVGDAEEFATKEDPSKINSSWPPTWFTYTTGIL